MSKIVGIIDKILAWRRKYISERNFILIASGLVGVTSGLAAVLLKETVHFIHHNLTSEAYNENYYQLLYPIIGMAVTIVLAHFLYREQLGHAITDILYSISKRSSIMGKGLMYTRMITSAITVGFGGSAGLESPIVLTGSAIGSNIGQTLHLNYQMRTLMLGCGTAGVISAIFNAPIAGLIFSMEVILAEVTLTNFAPLLISSVSATLVSIILLGDDVLFSFAIVDRFDASDVPFYILLGIICGLSAMYFTYILHQTEHILQKVENKYIRAVIGGVLLSVLIFICPPVYGEGYSMIIALLHGDIQELLTRSVLFTQFDEGWLLVVYLLVIILIKAIASAITVGSGGSGGTFAPSLFLGGVTGFAFAKMVNLMGFAHISESNFTLVGMCGVLCGTQYAPLTAIFLIAELTGGYTLFIPLMTVSALAFITVTYYNPDSPYIRDLLLRGEFVKGGQDKRVLNNLSINEVIENDLIPVDYEATLADMIKVISKSRRNVFPVLDAHKRLMGVVTLDDVRESMFDTEKQKKLKVKNLMQIPPATIELGENMTSVMRKFEKTNAWNLPVVIGGRYIGFVSKSRIFGLYRKQLMQQQIN